MDTKQETKTKHAFAAQATKALKIVTNFLYQNKDIVLRELISNASDACQKLNMKYLNDSSAVENEVTFKITIQTNPGEKTITVTDNGIGMNKEDLINNLGTVAKSGTEEFINSLPPEKRGELVGQFGVGFYSAFMIANKVVVKTRKAKESQSWMWISDGIESFEIEESQEDLPVGTSIILHLKDEDLGFLDKFKIEHIVTHHSNYVAFPIEYINEAGESERLNSSCAIWVKHKNEITDEEHSNFFRDIAHVGGAPWMIIHNHNEGAIEYTNLLYVPSLKPFDLFHPDRRCSIQLYVKRIFITEDNVQIIPQYLRFLRGIVDCSDLPLNVSRETLQNNDIITKIRKSITNKVISELYKKAKEDSQRYVDEFWKNFGAVLKEGLCEAMPTDEREKLLSICRFYSIKNGKFISLDEYLNDAKEKQEHIFYASGASIDAIKKNPNLSAFIDRDIDVLCFTDTVDDFWNTVTSEYHHMKFKSITRSDINLKEFPVVNTESLKQEIVPDETEVSSLIEFVTQTLKDVVASVRISNKLSDVPACLAVSEGAMDIRMERFMIDQKQLISKSKKILEINPSHPIVIKLMKNLNSSEAVDIVHLLFDQACIIEGEEIEDVGELVKRINKFILAL